MVKSIDALSREQFRALIAAVGLQNAQVALRPMCVGAILDCLCPGTGDCKSRCVDL